MCDDPRTHDTFRTAAALLDAHIRGDTSADGELLRRDGDNRYAFDVAHRLAAMAEPIAHRSMHTEMVALAAVIDELDRRFPGEIHPGLAQDSLRTCELIANYLAAVLIDARGRDAALQLSRGWIAQLACEH